MKTRARREVVFSNWGPSELWLVFVVVLDSVWEMVSEASDLRSARRTRSRIAMVESVFCRGIKSRPKNA